MSSFTRAGVKGGELPLGHEPPKVRPGESAVLGRVGSGFVNGVALAGQFEEFHQGVTQVLSVNEDAR